MISTRKCIFLNPNLLLRLEISLVLSKMLLSTRGYTQSQEFKVAPANQCFFLLPSAGNFLPLVQNLNRPKGNFSKSYPWDWKIFYDQKVTLGRKKKQWMEFRPKDHPAPPFPDIHRELTGSDHVVAWNSRIPPKEKTLLEYTGFPENQHTLSAQKTLEMKRFRRVHTCSNISFSKAIQRISIFLVQNEGEVLLVSFLSSTVLVFIWGGRKLLLK